MVICSVHILKKIVSWENLKNKSENQVMPRFHFGVETGAYKKGQKRDLFKWVKSINL